MAGFHTAAYLRVKVNTSQVKVNTFIPVDVQLLSEPEISPREATDIIKAE